jgi:uncharacterized membrane protein YhaH (DUF805 family)
MNLTQLLFSFEGRIKRLDWWVASLAVGVASAIVTGIIEFAAKASGASVVDLDTQQFEPTGVFSIAVLALSLVSSWINFALCVKRLHDRDRSGWWLVWQALVLVLAVVMVIVAIAMHTEQMSIWYALAGASGLAALIISIWLFVEIGFLRGTQGPNRFGPDPLGSSRSDANL